MWSGAGKFTQKAALNQGHTWKLQGDGRRNKFSLNSLTYTVNGNVEMANVVPKKILSYQEANFTLPGPAKAFNGIKMRRAFKVN